MTPPPLPDRAGPPPSAPPSEEWYVGVAGAPLGPIGLSVIREKALAGAVDGDSLVWREGLDEWQPLRTFPELLAIVAKASGSELAPGVPPPLVPPLPARMPAAPPALPPALPAPTPAAAPVAAFAPPPALAAFDPPPALAAAPEPAAPPPPTPLLVESVAAFAPAPAPLAPSAFPELAPPPRAPAPAPELDLADDFFSRPAEPLPESSRPVGLATAPHLAPPASSPSPVAVPPPPEPEPLVAVPGEIDPLVPRRRSGMSPIAYALIAMAATFGGVSAYFLLAPKPPPPPPPAPVATAPQQAQPQIGPAEGLPPPPPIDDEPAPGTTAGAAPSRPGAPIGQRPDKPSASAAPIDTSGFSAPGSPGPAPVGDTPPAALGQLSAAEISLVVEQNRPGIKRRCWQPALEGRAGTGPANVRVMASVTIAASGAVQSASASGGERDFPGLSSCIAARIKTWRFSPSSGSTPVNIPFVFAGQ